MTTQSSCVATQSTCEASEQTCVKCDFCDDGTLIGVWHVADEIIEGRLDFGSVSLRVARCKDFWKAYRRVQKAIESDCKVHQADFEVGL